MIEEAIADKKGPGRPKSTSNLIKKGKASWQEASVTEVHNKEPGYRYRWINKNPDNISKKEHEQWEKVSGLTSDRSQSADDGRISSGKNIASTNEKHDLILYRIPEDVAQARDEVMNAKVKRQTLGLTSHFKGEVKKDAPTHGEITISSLRNTEVIK